MGTVRITRKELYQRVWSEAVTRLAKEYGLSDVGFAKLCKRNKIPRPPRGYWARKAVGQKVSAEPLPDTKADWDIQINAYGHPFSDPNLAEEAKQVHAKAVPSKPIAIEDNLKDAHPLVLASLRALEDAATTDEGFLRRPETGCLAITVSKDSLRRALLIMDAIIKTFVARGFRVAIIKTEEATPTQVELLGTSVWFGLSESLMEKKEDADDLPSLEGEYVFRHNRIAVRHGQRPIGTEVVLDINKYKCAQHGSLPLKLEVEPIADHLPVSLSVKAVELGRPMCNPLLLLGQCLQNA